jgi:ADP-ribose pyrophosphatase
MIGGGLRRAGSFAPCIGIASWRHVSQSTRAAMHGEARVVRMHNSKTGGLEPHHSHFFLVQESSDSLNMQRENRVRLQLEELLQQDCHVPRTFLAIDRSPDLFDAVVDALKSNCAVVVIRAAGGAPLTIAQFIDRLRPVHRHALSDSHREYKQRGKVPVHRVPWRVPYAAYQPVYFVHQSVLDASSSVDNLPDEKFHSVVAAKWADPEDLQQIPDTEALAYRVSFEGPMQFDADGFPVNPRGRTGMRGRGLLGRWGPNHAIDPIITRRHPEQRGILQVLVRWRDDASCYGLPGHFARVGESAGSNLRASFDKILTRIGEDGNLRPEIEALTEELMARIRSMWVSNLGNESANMPGLFEAEQDLEDRLIYRGYVDDPRNTDQAWVETTAAMFHCEDRLAMHLNFVDGDNVRWIDICEDNADYSGMYATQREWVDRIAIHLLSEEDIPGDADDKQTTRKQYRLALVSPEAASIVEELTLQQHSMSGWQTEQPPSLSRKSSEETKAGYELARKLHIIGTYRQLVTIYVAAERSANAPVDAQVRLVHRSPASLQCII